MKFKIQFKDPDGVYSGIKDAAEDAAEEAAEVGLSGDEAAALAMAREETLEKAISTWVEYKEYITVEFDTVKKTATVVPR